MSPGDDDDAIEKLVLGSFPYPVAINLAHARAARQKGDSFREFLHLLVTTEALLQLVGSALLLDLVSCESAETRRTRLSAVVSDLEGLNKPTIGTWTYVVARATEELSGGDGFFRQYSEGWGKVCKRLCKLREIRNVSEHPKVRPSELEAGKHLGSVRKHLRHVLEGVAFLADYHLLAVGPTRPGIGSQSILATSLRGASLPYEGRWLPINTRLHEEDLVLISPKLEEYLSLRPFYLARRGQDDADRIWAFCGVAALDNPIPQYSVVDRFSDRKQFLLRPDRDAAPSKFLQQVAGTPSHLVRGALDLEDAARSQLMWDAGPPEHVGASVGADQLRPLLGGRSLSFEGVRTQERAKGVVLRGDLDGVDAGSRLVVKVCRADAGPVGRERFEREYDLLSRTSHPHVTRAHALVRQGDELYLVLPYVEGVSLAGVLQAAQADRDAGPYSEATACRLARQLVEATAAIHRVGEHGDLKPANVIVNNAEDPTHLTVIDLGAGQSDELATTSTATAFGTRGYVAPERFVGWDDLPLDGRRADLYAMVVTIYEIFEGVMPWIDAEREGISVDVLDAPRRWRVLLRWCGRLDPSERPASAVVCLRFLDGEVDAPDEISGRVEHRSTVHRVVAETSLWSASFLCLTGMVVAAGEKRPEYLLLPATAVLVAFFSIVRGFRRERFKRNASSEQQQPVSPKIGGAPRGAVVVVLGVLRQLVGPTVSGFLAFGLILFASQNTNQSLGLSGATATAVHLGTAMALVALWAVLKLRERRWD
ncbi:MAG: serine/threonine-protein kinase [Nannocystaceae bacterium]